MHTPELTSIDIALFSVSARAMHKASSPLALLGSWSLEDWGLHFKDVQNELTERALGNSLEVMEKVKERVEEIMNDPELSFFNAYVCDVEDVHDLQNKAMKLAAKGQLLEAGEVNEQCAMACIGHIIIEVVQEYK